MLGTVDGDAVNDAGDVQDTVDVCLVLLSVIVAVPWVDPVVREKVADVLLETDMLEMLAPVSPDSENSVLAVS